MGSVFIDNLKSFFGESYSENKYVKEALHDLDDQNGPIALLGDCILNLTVKQIAYYKCKDSEYIDDMRQNYADRSTNKKVLNQDAEFVDFLVPDYVKIGDDHEIGAKKVDRFLEGLIGAVYLSKGFETATQFTKSILTSNPCFQKKFDLNNEE